MKIVFISVHVGKVPFAFPLSSAMLAAAVEGNKELGPHIKTEILDFHADTDSVSGASGLIREQSPDIAAFSIYVWNRDFILELIKSLKSASPGISLIAGGAEVTADPLFFSSQKDIDWIVRSEGEQALQEYLGRILSDAPPEAKASEGGELQMIRDLDSLPSPFLNRTIDPARYDGVLWELSRGCPFACDFCFESRGSKRVRRFSLERIGRELDMFRKAGVDQVFVLDPTFNIDRDRAVQILSLIKEKAPDIHFTFEARSEFLDEETAVLFGEITCSVQIGLQSANPDVLAKVNRTLDRDDFSDKILFLHEAGAVYGFDLIYGLPGDTLEFFLDSLDFALSLVPNHLDIFPLAILKGTVLYDKTEAFALEYRKSPPYTVISTRDFSEEDLREASLIAQAADFFYNRGKAVPWFNLFLENLDTTPSEFFMDFLLWTKTERIENPGDIRRDSEIVRIQKAYLLKCFSEQEKPREGLLAGDIVACFNPVEPVSGSFDMDQVMDYLDSGISDLTEILFFSD